MFDLFLITLLLGGIVLLGYIENNDMKQINSAFFRTDWTNPSEVFEYMHLLTTKPLWRICLIASALFAFVTTAAYTYMPHGCEREKVPFWLFFVVILSFSFICMSGYLSFFSFHILVPNGGQDNYSKLSYADCRNVVARWG